jgi:hypothetical protein
MTQRSLTFPVSPARVSYFREPSGEPRVDRRWQRTPIAGQNVVDFRWVGQCISPYCANRPIYLSHPDGLIHEGLGYSAAMMMRVDISGDPENPDYRLVRTCFQCASNDRLMERVKEATQELLRINPDAYLGFLQWPPDTVLAKARDDGQQSVRSMVTV